MKRLIIFIVALFLLVATIIFIKYLFLVKDSEKSIESQFLEVNSQLIMLAEESIQTKNLLLFSQLVDTLQKNSGLKDTEITFKKHLIDPTVLLNTIPYSDKFWSIIDITIDANDGIIYINENGLFELNLNNKSLNDKWIIPITFYFSKDNIVRNSVFFYQAYIKIAAQNKITGVSLHEKTIEKNDYILHYAYDKNIQHDKILINTLQFSLLIIGITIALLMICYWVYQVLVRQKLISSIHILNQYIHNILESKMVKDSSLPIIVYDELSHLHKNIIELTNKYVTVANELAINKDIIIQKERRDELTGLPNKKSFESDLKFMFVANKNGYIIILGIDKIGLFTKSYGPEIVDTLIEAFAKTIQDFFRSNTKYKGTVYRFFGGEFAMIVYDSDSVQIEEVVKHIIKQTEILIDKYYFFENAVFYGAIPFDRYETIESIFHGAQDAYELAYEDKTKKYFIANASHQLELNKKLESTVKDIIARNDFVLQYIYDTYSFGTNPALLMQEISPLLIDSFTFESIPRGKFISVAEKFGLMSEFDRALIQKVLDQIKLGDMNHQVGIILSVSSLSNEIFLEWLREQISNDLMSKIIFIAPCYTVASHSELFKSFIQLLKINSIQFMIKHYDPIDLPLDMLLSLKPDYLKLEKTLCQDFKKNTTKQHAVKQILLFCENNNIKVIGDSVKNKEDYLAFEMLDFYGTTK